MLIGLHGRKFAGKDTAFQRLVRLLGDRYEVIRVSFADKLYRSAAAALGVTVEQLYEWKADPAVRIQIVRLGVSGEDDADINDIELLAELDVREYLQKYGTEAHRDIFGDNFWVEQVEAELAAHAGKIVAVTDARFPNEAEAIHRAGGVIARVIGPPDVENAGDGHASEKPLDGALIDANLLNQFRDGDFSGLDRDLMELVHYLFLANPLDPKESS